MKLYADGSVNVNSGAADIGTGTKTVMAQVVAEELGVPVEKIQIEHADTGTTQYSGPSGGSKTVPSDMPAARAAAIEVRNKLLAGAAEELKLPFEELRLEGPDVVSTKDPSKKLAVTAVKALERHQVLVGVGTRGPNVEGKVISMFATHFAEVEVNTRTGEVTVTRLLAAQDSARVMNRLTFECQVQGGLVMGLGLGADRGAGPRPADREDVQRELARLQDPDGPRRSGRSRRSSPSTSSTRSATRPAPRGSASRRRSRRPPPSRTPSTTPSA